jgi:hypothetical protein
VSGQERAALLPNVRFEDVKEGASLCLSRFPPRWLERCNTYPPPASPPLCPSLPPFPASVCVPEKRGSIRRGRWSKRGLDLTLRDAKVLGVCKSQVLEDVQREDAVEKRVVAHHDVVRRVGHEFQVWQVDAARRAACRGRLRGQTPVTLTLRISHT